MYYLEHSEGEHKRMRNAVLVAAGLHVLLAFAVSFSSQSSPRYSPQIEVTLATRPSQSAPQEARHIAQQNQQGSGQEAETARITRLIQQLGDDAFAKREAASKELKAIGAPAAVHARSPPR